MFYDNKEKHNTSWDQSKGQDIIYLFQYLIMALTILKYAWPL